MSKAVYQITINNWEKHNGAKKKNHRYFLLETRFFSDDKIAHLSAVETRLYLYLLTIAADLNQSSYTIHTALIPSYFRVRAESLQSMLIHFEQLQLLTAEKITSFIIEKKTKEKKTKQENTTSKQVTKTNQELNKKIWEVYKENYFLRYKVEPVRNASVNSKISQLGKRVGDDALEIVKFYLQHNDSFYLKNLHSIGLCLRDCESLHTQCKRGVAITTTQIRAFEKNAQEIERQRQINTMWDDENA